MMKRNLIALGLTAALITSSVSGCSAENKETTAAESQTTQDATVPETESMEESSSQELEPASETESAVSSETVDTILGEIKEAYGETYMPNMELDPQMLKDITGITPDQYLGYAAEMPLISTFVETFIGIEAADGAADDVETALNAYRDGLLENSLQYPMNLPKIQASQVVRHDNFVFFVMLGAPDDASLEEGDEAALESAVENNQIAIDIINANFE